jgi:hypothetical protein
MLVDSRHGPEPYDWSMRPPSRPKAAYSEIGDKARHNVRYGFEPEVPPPARMSLLPPTADIGTPTAQVRVVPTSGNWHRQMGDTPTVNKLVPVRFFTPPHDDVVAVPP